MEAIFSPFVSAVPIVHLAATWGMVGVIWFVQVVHYPLFNGVGKELFPEYSKRNANRTTYVVLPLMLIEAATASALLFMVPEHQQHLAQLAAFLLVLVWASTFLIQVPLHERLQRGFEPSIHTSLVRSNWIRTVLWSVRGLAACSMLP
jgi:hypothetical protein